MHFLCANLIAEQTVLLARSNAFHRLHNGAELMLGGVCLFTSTICLLLSILSSLTPSSAPQTLCITYSTVPFILPAIVLRSDVTVASSEPLSPPLSPSHQSQVECEILERVGRTNSECLPSSPYQNNQPLAIIGDGEGEGRSVGAEQCVPPPTTWY